MYTDLQDPLKQKKNAYIHYNSHPNLHSVNSLEALQIYHISFATFLQRLFHNQLEILNFNDQCRKRKKERLDIANK